MGDYRKLLKEIREIGEEVTSGDIATVDAKIEANPIRRRDRKMKKGKKCKLHGNYNCQECMNDDEKWS